MHKNLRAVARRVVAFACLLYAFIPLSSEAQTSTAITRGVQWLSSQVQPDGSLQNEAQSIATPLQSRAEAAQTLQLLGTLPGSLAGSINAVPEINTQYLSRKIISLAASGIDTSGYVTILTQRQNTDGGYGGAFGYASDVINTSWAVLALAQTNQTGNAAATLARTFITTQISVDGGVVDGTLWSRSYDSALALQALVTTPDNSNATYISGLITWLKLQQGADGSWQSNSFLTACATIALAPVNSDATVSGNARNYLLSKQAADGSWNDDPFLTAVVLRALAGQSANQTGTTSLQGQVVDAVTNTPISGAAISIGGGSQTATSDANGNFKLVGIAAGSYAIGAASSGYNGATHNVTAVTGQTVNLGVIGLTQLSTSTIVMGQIVAASNGTPLLGVAITVSGAINASAVTDANGRYVIIGTMPGAVSISASLAGYQAATGSGTLVAGQTTIFAPGLYANGQTAPGSIQVTGTVVAAGSNTPLAGASVQVSGSAGNASAATATNGQFTLTLNAGSYSGTFSLAGYASQTRNFIGATGANINLGIVSLSPQLTSSTIAGIVTNASNQAIAGATVQVVGTIVTTTTGADGSYTLSNVSGSTVSVRASAAGFDSQTVSLQLGQAANVTQNFTLPAQTAGNLSIGNLTVTPATVGSNANVTVATTISNSAQTVGSAIVQLQIFDSTGKLIGNGQAYDTNSNAIGQISVSNSQPMAVNFVWNTAQFGPDTYTLAVRLVQVDSITRATPQGTQLAASNGTVTVTGQAHFSGTVGTNPPVLQAGTNTAVQITTTIRNDGNIPLPAQSMTLSVINTVNNAVVLTMPVASNLAAVNGLQDLTFPSWTPASGGNYKLVLAASDPNLGSATGTLYVGDAGSATYTTNKLVVPTGTQTVRGTINVLGQNVANGSISDPLAPLIRTAVQKAMAYNYPAAAFDTLSSRCLRCHVQSQVLVGGELTRALTNYDSFKSNRDLILNAITMYQQSNGAIDGYGGYQKTQTMLGMWALNAWHKSSEVLSTLAKGARFLISDQNQNGSWDPDHVSAWWSTEVANTAFNVKSLVDINSALTQAPAGSAVNYSTAPISQGNSNPFGLASDAAGNVYVLNYYGGTVSKISPDGSSVPYMSGLTYPTAMVFASDGTAYVSTYLGLYRRNADGSATQFSVQRGSGLAIGSDGNFYMSASWDNKISKITPAGVASDYIVGGALSSPWGIAFSAAGDLLVANSNGQNILRFHPDMTYDVPVAWTYGSTRNIQVTANGWMVTTDTGLYFYDSDLHAERLLYSSMWGLAATPDGSIWVGDMNASVASKLIKTPIDTTALVANMGTSIGTSTTWLLQDSNTDSSNNLQLAQRLIGLNAAKTYYQGQSLATTLQAKMVAVGAQLRANVNSDGGWGWTTANHNSDSLVTAQVGVAMDALNPSASDPIVQNAVRFLLGSQHADGTWYSENGIMSTPLATTTWVSIWLPIVLDRLGGIDTDLSVTFPQNVAMSNPDTAPNSVVGNTDGSSTALWHLTGVTSAGQTVNYDLTLATMAPGEVRAVSTDAHLTFKNSFSGGTVNAPINIPQVTASAFLSLGVTTDRQTYPANTLVNITGQVTNTAASLSGGRVAFAIYAPDNTLVATLGAMPFNQLAAAASINLGMTWNTGNTLAAPGYYVQATLSDVNGQYVGAAKSAFAITSTGAATAIDTLTTDKQVYQPNDIVNLSDRLINLSTNTVLNNLTIVTTVTGPGGAVVFTKTETLPQLVASALKNYAYSVQLNAAPAGSYSATVVITSGGANVAQGGANFTVASSAVTGSGLGGSVSISPAQITFGNPVTPSYSVTNGGNSAFTGLSLTLSIVDPVAQKVLASFPNTQTLAMGASYAGSATWAGAGTVGNTYVAVLTASVGGNTLTLGQANFTLIAPPIKLGITQALWNSNRVLVLTGCTDGTGNSDDSGSQGDDGNQGGDSSQGSNNQGSGNTQGGDSDGDNDDAPTPTTNCTAARYVAIDKALTNLGLQHVMTTNTKKFTFAMRSGLYDTLWIASNQSQLSDALTAEVSEVVYGGASLIVDGASSEDNGNFDLLGGIKSRKGVAANQSVTLNGSFYTAATILPTVGKAQSFVVDGSGQTQGTFSAATGNGNGDSNGDNNGNGDANANANGNGDDKSPQTVAALVSNTVGAGRTLIAGFDLGTTLSTQATTWNTPLNTTFNAIAPSASASLTPGEVLSLQMGVANQANAVDVDVKTSLPATAAYVASTPSATFSEVSDSVDWDFNLDVAQSEVLYLTTRAPSVGGSYNLQTVVSTGNGGSLTAYGNPRSFPITVTPAATTASSAIAALQALALTSKSDQGLRTDIIASLNQAMTNFKLNTYAGYGAAIGELVNLADSLAKFSATNSTAIKVFHGQIDMILQEAQWRWTLLQPEVSANLSLKQTNRQPTITVTDSLTNITSMTVLNNLSVVTTVTAPSGATFFAKTETLTQFGVGEIQQYSYGISLNGTPAALPGTYMVKMVVSDGNNTILAQSSGKFKVDSGNPNVEIGDSQ